MTAPSSSTRDRLLDATETCLRRRGIRRTTMTEIADEAGLSRAGLYKHFPDKASLVVAALARTDEQFWADADARVSAAEDLGAKVADAVRIAIEHEPGALLLQLKADEPDAFAATVGTGLTQLLPGMALFWHPHLERAVLDGEVRPALDVPTAAEWVLRVVLSLVTVPGEAVDTSDPASVRAFVDEYLLPSLR